MAGEFSRVSWMLGPAPDFSRKEKSGPAIVPGKPDQSLLIKRIESDEMPPREAQSGYSVRPITSSELEKLRRWIAAGAPAEPGETPATDSASESPTGERDHPFWSFRPPRRPSIPKVRSENLARNPIDTFLLDRLESDGLSFSSQASRLTLMRRAYFDLIGLPPTPGGNRKISCGSKRLCLRAAR